MMKSEFIEAAQKIAVKFGRTFQADMPAAIWEAIQSCYRSERLNTVCIGPDRHERFALWVYQNQAKVNRLAVWIDRRNSKRRDAIRQQIVSLQLELSLSP